MRRRVIAAAALALVAGAACDLGVGTGSGAAGHLPGKEADDSHVITPIKELQDLKAALDACTDAGLWLDDGQVIGLRGTKRWAQLVGPSGMQLDVEAL